MEMPAANAFEPAGRPQGSGVSRFAKSVGLLLGRSLFPLLTVAIISGTLLWGPWVTLVLGILCFAAVSYAA